MTIEELEGKKRSVSAGGAGWSMLQRWAGLAAGASGEVMSECGGKELLDRERSVGTKRRCCEGCWGL